jgi:hypothetical protein
MEFWNVGLRLIEPILRPVSLRVGGGFGENNGMMGYLSEGANFIDWNPFNSLFQTIIG